MECKNPDCKDGLIPHENDSSVLVLCPECHGTNEEQSLEAPTSAREVASVSEMINQLQSWAFQIKDRKRNKAILLMNAAYALKQMTDRLYKYEGHDQKRVM